MDKSLTLSQYDNYNLSFSSCLYYTKSSNPPTDKSMGFLATNFIEKNKNYEFEVYGVNNYLLDFFHSGQSLCILKDNVNASDDEEIGFSFVFPFDVEGKDIFEFVKLLRRKGFYY